VEAARLRHAGIASNRGSMPELIDQGVTGFWSTASMKPWMPIGRYRRNRSRRLRAAVSARFTVDRMADRYLELYRSLLG